MDSRDFKLPERPGCLMAYIVVTAIGSALGLAAFAFLMQEVDGGVYFIGTIVLGVAALVLAWGLWRQQEWARQGQIVLLAIGIVFNIISLFTGFSDLTGGGMVGVALSVAFSGYMIHWFLNNAEYFA